MNVHSGNLLSRLLGVSLIALVLTSCIRPEAPNAEADIVTASFDGIEQLDEVAITNSRVSVTVEPWADRTAVTPHFTLTPGATISPEDGTPMDFSAPVTFTVTSEDGQWSKDYEVAVVPRVTIPVHHSFEEVTIYKQVDTKEDRFQQFVITDEMNWGSPNEGFMLSLNFGAPGNVKNPLDYPVCQSPDGVEGKCAMLRTLSTGKLAATFMHKPLASGTLFLGTFDASMALAEPLDATKFGVTEKRVPLMLTGHYKYTSGDVFTDENMKEYEGKRDMFEIYALLYETDEETTYLNGETIKDSKNIVLKAQLKDPRETDEWVYFEAPFEPQNGKTIDRKKLADGEYKFTIVMTSSKEGATFSGAIGSTLMVDELTIYFDE